MNTLLEIRDLDTDNRIPVHTDSPELRPVDRLALRVGLALLLWGQRRMSGTDAAELRRLQLEREHAEREKDRLVARGGLYR